MGVPFGTFVAASNVNAAMKRFYQSGALTDEPSVQTVSSAMDVARPSNLERLLVVYGQDVSALRARILATRHEDAAVLAAMDRVLRERGYLMDPHTAVGYLGLEAARTEGGPGPGLLLIHRGSREVSGHGSARHGTEPRRTARLERTR